MTGEPGSPSALASTGGREGRSRGTVILGVAGSDTHVVANHLIAHMLREKGYEVVNLGACTPLQEFMEAYERSPDAVAIVIGSLNGHAKDDLSGLAELKQRYGIRCPVVLGGNLSVGSQKELGLEDYFKQLGVDVVLNRPELLAQQLLALGVASPETMGEQQQSTRVTKELST